MSLVGLNIGTQDSLSAKTRRYADYYRQLADGTIKEVYDDETVTLGRCFVQTDVERVTFTKCTDIVDRGGFQYCTKLFFADFPELERIGINSFYGTRALTSIFFPKVAAVDTYGVYNSFVEQVELPIVKLIRGYAFEKCKNLKEIKIPVCSEIRIKAFEGCSSLEKIFLDGVTSVPTLGDDVLTGTPETLKIIVPDALVDSFKTATNWSTYAGRIIGVSEYEATQAQ